MADQKETVVLDFKIEQGDALNELAQTKKAIIGLKDEQKELDQAYKSGAITLDKYVKEQVQLEASLKKQQSQYSNIQKSVTGVKTSFDKLSESVKNQASSVNIAGVSLSNFINPATATIAILGGLFKAYSTSVTGAKDLEFAQNQLSAATGILSESFAKLVSSSEDGEGFFTGLLNGILNQLGPGGIAIAAASKGISKVGEELDDLRRAEITARANISDRLEDNAQKLTEISQEQTKYLQKLQLQEQITENLRDNQAEIVKVKEDELAKLEAIYKANTANEENEARFLNAQRELNKERTKTSKLVEASLRAEDNIKDAETKRLEVLQQQTSELERQQRIAQNTRDVQGERVSGIEELGLRAEDEADGIKLKTDATESFAKAQDELAGKVKKLNDQTEASAKAKDKDLVKTLALSAGFGVLQGAFGQATVAYKAVSISRAIIDTYTAATAALAPPPEGLGPLLGPILAGVTIAAGLANVAQISQAAGGGDFVTKGPTLLMVGDNPGGKERVQVTPLSGKGQTKVRGNLVQMAGGGSFTADGGLIKDSMRTNVMNSNTMVQVELVYSEYKRFTQGINYKENLTSV